MLAHLDYKLCGHQQTVIPPYEMQKKICLACANASDQSCTTEMLCLLGDRKVGSVRRMAALDTWASAQKSESSASLGSSCVHTVNRSGRQKELLLLNIFFCVKHPETLHWRGKFRGRISHVYIVAMLLF